MWFPTSDADCGLSPVCSVHGVSPSGCIGSELTNSNVSVFITSDAGNAWRQVRTFYYQDVVLLLFHFLFILSEMSDYKLRYNCSLGAHFLKKKKKKKNFYRSMYVFLLSFHKLGGGTIKAVQIFSLLLLLFH